MGLKKIQIKGYNQAECEKAMAELSIAENDLQNAKQAKQQADENLKQAKQAYATCMLHCHQ